jgi:hypothetical protein
MNHIKKLQFQVSERDMLIKGIQEGIGDFRKHLKSSKFHEDPTIQVQDVFNWLERIKVTGDKLFNEQYTANRK